MFTLESSRSKGGMGPTRALGVRVPCWPEARGGTTSPELVPEGANPLQGGGGVISDSLRRLGSHTPDLRTLHTPKGSFLTA